MRRVIVLLIGIAVVSVTLLAQTAAFEVASVKPNTGSDRTIPFPPNPPDGIRMVNHPLDSIIRYAFKVESFLMTGTPRWATEERFDIAAKAASPISEDQRRDMMRSLLAERFQLRTHWEKREQNVYVLTRLRSDSALGPALKTSDCVGDKCGGSGNVYPAGGRLQVRGMTLDRLAQLFSNVLHQVVRNDAGISGAFDIQMTWRPDTADASDPRPSFFTAVEEHLGLKLASQRGMVDLLVIDSVSRPTPD